MKKLAITVLFLISVQHLYPQQRIRNAEGQWAVVNITPEQAREKAIEEAKKDALRKAGVSERIFSSQTVSVLESNKESAELFSMFSSIEMNGAVTDWEIKKSEFVKNAFDGQVYATVVIDATVKKFITTPDPELKIDVRGLRSGYRNGDAITFSIHPNKAGYLKIFLFENINDAALLFPNDYEHSRKFEEKETVKFPTISRIEYIAEKSSDDSLEHNLLLFVYTKSDIPFYGAATRQRVLGWINGIEPNEREVVLQAVVVTE